MPAEDLTPWLNRVKKASSRADVFSILDQFRKVEWTDEQCAAMGKLYIRVLERVGKIGAQDDANTATAASSAAANEENGPVWYEKM